MIRKTLFVLILTAAFITAYGVGDAGAGDKTCTKTKTQKAARTAAPGCAATCAVKCAEAPDTPKCKASKQAAACKAGKKAACKMDRKMCAAKCKCTCEGKCSGKCGCTCAGCCCSSDAHASHAKAVGKVVDKIPYRETKRMVVSGSVVCGGCTMEGIDRCQPMVKTGDGKIYPLVRSAMVKKMGGCRGGETTYRIKGRVKKVYGVRYLDVTSYSAL